MSDGFVVHVTAPQGATVYRTRLRRRYVAAMAALVLAILAAVFGRQAYALHSASVDLTKLRSQRADEQHRLDDMARRAETLQQLNLDSKRAIERIERTLGAPQPAAASVRAARTSLLPVPDSGPALSLRLDSLARESAATRAQTSRLASLAGRVLNLRRLATIARRRMIAAIPSLNPVNGTINAAFGWRTDPWPEFHKGVDLAADYGTPVHAAGAGMVAAAGWEGGFGNKVDIDHGNGFHTWYCHLSRIDVTLGQRVKRDETIARVGSTGESTGAHLHYQVMHDGVAVDPEPFLRGVPPNLMASLPPDPRVQ